MTNARSFITFSNALLASIALIGLTGPAAAAPRTMNTSGLSPAQCYQKDSDCTQFCGAVTSGMRYECFAICDRMLNRCLDTGEWSDSLVADPTQDPGPLGPINPADHLSALLLNLLLVASDTDQDGLLPLTEIEAFKAKVLVAEDTSATKVGAADDDEDAVKGERGELSTDRGGLKPAP
jgi:hypothetical protein